ncbi:FecR domain-containing protein [bacterium]|nr:FecR domain-containing protein [bacterium]
MVKSMRWVAAVVAVVLFLSPVGGSWAQEEGGEAPEAEVSAEAEEASEAEAPAEAKVLRLDGTADVKSPADTSFRAVSSGLMVPMSSTIRIHAGSKAQIELPNGVIVLVKEFTIVRLDALSKDKDAGISIPIGEFLIGMKAPMPAGKVFRVTTPAAVAGIRGTLFWGLADADLTSTFACFHGSITLDAAGKTVTLEPGMLSATKHGEAPADAAAHSVPASYLETFAVEGSLEGLPDLLKEE